MNAIAPLPSLVPENAPFSSEQRAWLNGFFSAYLGVAEAAAGENAEAAEPEDFPWHDATLAMPERMALAAQAKPERKLMAAMAQLDCGQCGYLCQTYAEAVWSGAEADMGRCVPGGKERRCRCARCCSARSISPGPATSACCSWRPAPSTARKR